MEKILFDTDIIIDYLRGHKQRLRNVFNKIEHEEYKAYLTTITLVELCAGLSMQNDKNRLALGHLLSYFEIIPLDQTLSFAAGEIKRKCGTGLADAIIAATAISMKAKLFTFNTKHYLPIAQLQNLELV
jgi:tRNA(fMet)-specific endonuclease VapC